ncbi:chemotaxis protein CheB [Candidatus Contubernalis alkaliaceticus]|uniref:chemotaxis protein CheB n=1 Tax=Candidatus Contubernalis alkaliaceticus TaxID=338645 RepID=UPI001F4C2591|nr:chemotaxis protein CheB [Candidatus Contubernalis alkalaceticus]
MINKEKYGKKEKNFSTSEQFSTTKVKTLDADFPIIGIGASAGGLEALELFLGNVPEKSGIAFIVVQHLDPTREGAMVELLKRVTPMLVFQAQEQTAVQPNCVYIIPPNKDMSLFHGALHLFEPVAPRGLRLPIDYLFRSMAEDRGERAIVAILSGMGTDGTLGLKAVKEKGGMVLVQEPASAKFDSMPKSSINTGLVDVVAPAEELIFKAIAYLKHKPVIGGLEQGLTDKDSNTFEKIAILLRSQTGHDFSFYKKTTVYRRIERRLGIHQINDLATYIRFLQENPQELQVLFKELLIGVTSFFRDPEAWEQLKKQAILELFATRSLDQPLRAWVPACSTGEEAYSLAIIFKEALEYAKPTAGFSFQVFATDLDRDAIKKARQGFYTANITADVSPERLRRFFIKEDGGYRVGKEIRNMVVFAPQNIIMDPPFTKIDIISCRNLLIYLTQELQKKLLALFHHSLNQGGFLFLGSSETIGILTDLFESLKGKSRLYRRLESSTQHKELFQFPSPRFRFPPGEPGAGKALPKEWKQAPNLENLANQLILQRYSPAAVMVNEMGDVLYTSGRVGRYLEPAAGKANWNIFVMTHESLGYKLSRSFQKAVSQNSTIALKNVKIGTEGEKQVVDITIEPLKEPEALRHLVMIVFTDVRVPVKTKETGKTSHTTANRSHVAELELDLQHSLQELQGVRQEMQSSQEELLLAYEELQSSNEELQSSNEEMTTSKEELQSLNEELQTVNYELQTKVDELSRTNNDMKNLLESTDIATLFLDNALCVRRFTARTAKIFKLIPGDVGRPITDIVSTLVYPELAIDAEEVLRTLVFVEKEVTTSNGRWCTVRIMPYRTLENKIDGLVLTFTDITVSKELEAVLRQTQADLKKRITNKEAELNKTKKRLQSEMKQKNKKENSNATMKNDESPEVPS